jgi:RNA polymerase sigma-70 factor, ECF subfamily
VAQMRALRVFRVMETFETDGALARSLLAGDTRAYSATWHRYVTLVRHIASRWMGRDPDVEDVTQEVFVRLLKCLQTLRNPESLRSFVAGVAIRTVRSERRRRRAASWLMLTETGAISDDRRFSNGGLDWRFELGQLHKVLAGLPARERNVVLLRHLEGMTLTEIAVARRLSVATVKRVLKRASSKIRMGDDSSEGRQACRQRLRVCPG